MTAVGSAPQSSSSWVSMAVEVVLPWVPQMQTAFGYWREMTPSSTERSMTVALEALAASSSGLSFMMAAV